MLRVQSIGLALVFGLLNLSLAQERRLLFPVDAVNRALLDAEKSEFEAPFWRYIWVSDKNALTIASVDTAINTVISRSDSLIPSVRLEDGELLRVDLRALAPKPEELKKVLEVWERLADTEPYFLANNQSVDVVHSKEVLVVTSPQAVIQEQERVILRPKIGQEFEILGRTTYLGDEWFKVSVNGQPAFIKSQFCKLQTKNGKKIAKKSRAFGLHCGPNAPFLAKLCNTNVPIVRHDYFIRIVTSTLDGGLYYEFRDITEAPEGSGQTDEDFFLTKFAGVDKKTVEKLEGDKKVIVIRSQVTGKPRAVVVFSGAKSKVNVNQGLVGITQDMQGVDRDPFSDPLREALNNKFKATEVFVEMGNGQIAYALFNGEGKLQRSAPSDVASDHTIPEPHSTDLQPAISCIRCHAGRDKRTEKLAEGWFHLPNDINLIVEAGGDIFGQKNKPYDPETLDRLASLYSGNLDKPLARARDDLNESLLRLTRIPGDNEKSTVTTVHSHLSRVYNRYWYDMVTPKVACEELGVKVEDDEQALQMFRLILPPLPFDADGNSYDDPVIVALRAGLEVNRFQWEEVYADAALRSQVIIKRLKDQQQRENDNE